MFTFVTSGFSNEYSTALYPKTKAPPTTTIILKMVINCPCMVLTLIRKN